MAAEQKTQHRNRLQYEKSPYLLQHADNPVDWYPWGEEAFEKAKKEDKPIFLSIGYSTCHWCHVMEHESFEDEDVAKLMNETFVNIKLDREERPDIDSIYMTACQVTGQRGGWPLTVIMTPEKKPFFIATYLPKNGIPGRAGMMQLVPAIQDAWKNRHDEIAESADSIVAVLQQQAQSSSGDALPKESLAAAFSYFRQSFDGLYGGFGTAPKFPTPHNLLFLLRYWKRSNDPNALEMVEKTLTQMRLGGVYDHVGFGFHRYATDHKWFLPHFEKMLYDQAMLALAYCEAYQATRKEFYADTAKEIFTYVLRDMTDPAGGFYSAEDADSEGEEGKFYLWKYDEVVDILGAEEGELFADVYNITKDGNYYEEATGHQPGTNIPHLSKPPADVAADRQMDEKALRQRLEAGRQKLFAVREKRVHPGKDDKVLTDWNGLMIAALAKGARILDEPKYMQAAQKAADFLAATMTDDKGRLHHRYRNGHAGLQGSIDDYAFAIWGLLELYETDFDVAHLERAVALAKTSDVHYWDKNAGGYYFSPDDGEELIARQKEIYDGAVPSGNSVMVLNLVKLARLTGNMDYEKQAVAIGKAFSDQVAGREGAYSLLMCGLDFLAGPAHEIVIAGKPAAADTQAMIAALNKQYLPNKVVLLRDSDDPTPLAKLADYTQYQQPLDDKATVYVCQNFTCQAPTTDVQKMLMLLQAQ